jgi:hypothetical protein
MYEVGDIIVRTGQLWNGKLAVIRETYYNNNKYLVSLLTEPNKVFRWSRMYFTMYQKNTINREPDWEV